MSFQKQKTHLSNKKYLLLAISSGLFFILAIIINFYAGLYAKESASSPVTDIILSNIPVFNVGLIFVYIPFILLFLTICIFIKEPKDLPFVTCSVSLLILIRSLFVSLTHLGPFPSAINIDSILVNNFTFGADLFFSGHVGIPFLMALIYWKNKKWRYVFLFSSIMFSAVVLMGHLHYSIDVLSAFFITYSVYIIATKIFPMCHSLYIDGLQTNKLPL